ncbi:Aminoglycoside phosphotransferase [Penicillium griseofulvum]|uniref:Aminoglycoside phosphotransferase n=1 Tax=Penicillium patulum TaxID=5078 RepID=A0A135LXW7_PENPA|nr:Aminoglycoside phosphotransferase [Penicillium griseofulvum]KXG53808.1 Aminoglycoside phosphotransferase [Penicillium griseofulvum]
MNELVAVVAESLGGQECVQVEKFPDGMFNKAFLFTMADGSQVVGKVPNPNAGRAHFTTASEVATMDFVRNVLGTPVPRVLCSNSSAKHSSVGAEYIIMEKAAGVQLSQFWPTMPIEEKLEIIKTISSYQKSWMSAPFSKYGSLYYSSDLDTCGQCKLVNPNSTRTEESRFAIGPSTGRDQLDFSKIEIDFDRGPWDSALEYHRAIGLREISCIEKLNELPRSPLTLTGPGLYSPSRSKKLAALRSYLKLADYLLPLDSSISASYLWHSDLHTENIFVDPQEPTKILDIIDWQSTELLPLFDHAREPYLLDYGGPRAEGLEPPVFPDLSKLSSADQEQARSLYFMMSLSALYNTLTYRDNPELYKAMEFRQTRCFELLLLAQNLLVDGEALYQASVLELEDEWPTLPSVQASGGPYFPIKLTADEVQCLEHDVSDTIKGMGLLNELKESLGEFWPEKGVVKHDEYDITKRLLSQAKNKLSDQMGYSNSEEAVWNKLWPFDN